MTATSFSQPTARTFELSDVVDYARIGRMRVPHFQRGLRWQFEDVKRLFDSIRKGYPIGSLLLWDRPSEGGKVLLGALKIDAPRGQAYWIVDGQQRVTSLVNALTEAGQRDPRFALAFDLRREEFARPSKADEAHVVPLPVLFDLERLLAWFDEHKELERGELFNRATRLAKTIRQFSIPAYIVSEQDAKVLQDIFDRMNNYGRRLSRAEVFSALHVASETPSGEAPMKLPDVAPSVETRTGFGRIDDDTILRAVLARRGADVTRDVRSEFTADEKRDVPVESPEDAYREGEEALVRAIGFLQDEAGVPHFSFLPYRYLLVVLTRYFAHFPAPNPRNRVLVRRWFWRAVLAGPNVSRGSWTGAMRFLAGKIVPHDESASAQHLIEAVDESPHRNYPQITRFRTNQADTRVLLCALWAKRPRSPITGELYDRGGLATALVDRKSAKDAVFTFFRLPPDAQRGWAANQTLAFGDELETGWPLKPEALSKSEWSKVLASHALDQGSLELYRSGDSEGFLTSRQERLKEVLRHFLEQMTESEFEDTPPLDELDLDEDDGDRDD
jgi:hypothetical protein